MPLGYTMRRVRISFDGLNVATILSYFASQGIAIYDIGRDTSCFITIDKVYAKQAVAYLRKKCYNVSVKETGLSAALSFVRKHIVAVVAVALSFVLLIASSKLCLVIDVDGAAARGEVLSALSACGIGIGTKMSSVDADKVENLLAARLGVAYATVKKTGSVLYVNTVALRTTEPPHDLNVRRDIVSTISGEVVEITCLQGTPVVSIGDIVNVGNRLIDGRRIFSDQTECDIYAMGRVKIKTTVCASVQYDGYVMQQLPTGNCFQTTLVRLLGKSYGGACPFDNYTLSAKRVLLYPLGVAVEKVVFYETVAVRVPTDMSAVLDELKAQAYALACDECGFDIDEAVYSIADNTVSVELIGYVYCQ